MSTHHLNLVSPHILIKPSIKCVLVKIWHVYLFHDLDFYPNHPDPHSAPKIRFHIDKCLLMMFQNICPFFKYLYLNMSSPLSIKSGSKTQIFQSLDESRLDLHSLKIHANSKLGHHQNHHHHHHHNQNHHLHHHKIIINIIFIIIKSNDQDSFCIHWKHLPPH